MAKKATTKKKTGAKKKITVGEKEPVITGEFDETAGESVLKATDPKEVLPTFLSSNSLLSLLKGLTKQDSLEYVFSELEKADIDENSAEKHVIPFLKRVKESKIQNEFTFAYKQRIGANRLLKSIYADFPGLKETVEADKPDLDK